MRRGNTKQAEMSLIQSLTMMTAGAVTGIVTTLIILLLCAYLVVAGTIPETAIGSITAVVCGIGALLAGFLAAKGVGKFALVTGIVTGAIYFVVLVVLGALFLEGLFPQKNVIAVLAGSVVGAALGSIAGAMLRR